MHMQTAPYEEVKVVRCVRGSIYDVIVDMRPQSTTYLKWFGIILSDKNDNMLYIPKGFAHGFQTLEDSSTINYMVSNPYEPSSEYGVRYDDPKVGIECHQR